MKAQCSPLFARVFSSASGGIVRTCACGRTHFNSSVPGDFDQGALESLRARAEVAPAKFVEVDYTVTTMIIAGMEIVEGCPCDLAARYERFILGHAEKLAEYLREYAQELREKAKAVDIPKEANS